MLHSHASCPEAFNAYVCWENCFSGRSALAIEKDIVDASEVLLQGIKTCRVAGKVLRTLAILFFREQQSNKIYLQRLNPLYSSAVGQIYVVTRPRVAEVAFRKPKVDLCFSPGAYILIFTL